jgi:hypothetical protein
MPHVSCVALVALVVLATPHWVTSGSAHQSSILVILEGKSTPKPKPNPWPICISCNQ